MNMISHLSKFINVSHFDKMNLTDSLISIFFYGGVNYIFISCTFNNSYSNFMEYKITHMETNIIK